MSEIIFLDEPIQQKKKGKPIELGGKIQFLDEPQVESPQQAVEEQPSQEYFDLLSQIEPVGEEPTLGPASPFGPLAEAFADASPEEAERLSNAVKESVARSGAQLAFGVPIGMAAEAIGGPKAGAVGFGAGAFGGEGVFQTLQHLGIAPGEPPKTSLEALNRMRDASVFSTTPDIFTRTGLKGLNIARNKLTESLRGQTSAVVKETRDVFNIAPLTAEGRRLQKEGIGFTLGQSLDNTFVDTVENMTASTWTGAPKIRKLADNTEKFLQSEMEAYVENIAKVGGSENIGDLSQSAIENTLTFKGLIEKGLYGELQRSLKGGGAVTGKFGESIETTRVIPMQPLKKEAATIEAGFKGTEALSPTLKKILDAPDKLDFQTMAEVRSLLLAVGRSSVDPSVEQTIANARKLAGIADELMEESFKSQVKALPTKAQQDRARDIWRAANEVTRQKKELFNSKFIKGMINKDPDIIVDGLIKATNADAIGMAKQAINDPSVWKQIQGNVLARLLEKGTKSIGGQKILGGDAVAGNIFKMKESVKKAFFSDNPVLFKNFEKMSRALARAQLVVRGTGGELMARFVQAKVAGDVIKGKSLKGIGMMIGSMAVLIAPGKMSKLFTNQKIIDGIVDGFKVAKSTKEASVYAGRIIGLLNANNIDYEVTTKSQFDRAQGSTGATPFSRLAEFFVNRSSQEQQAPQPPPANNLGSALLGR